MSGSQERIVTEKETAIELLSRIKGLERQSAQNAARAMREEERANRAEELAADLQCLLDEERQRSARAIAAKAHQESLVRSARAKAVHAHRLAKQS